MTSIVSDANYYECDNNFMENRKMAGVSISFVA